MSKRRRSSTSAPRLRAVLEGLLEDRLLDDVQDDVALVRAGGDVEKGQFVGALVVVALSEFHRVAHVAQAPGFCTAKLHAAGDFPVVDIEAWNNALC